jgi:hypothetical protein
MAKYRITEKQLQELFEKLEMKRVQEMNNYNYPAGSDTPDAPWNQTDSRVSKALEEKGDYKLLSVVSGQYLILNTSTNQLLYTMDEVWDDEDNDIKDELWDFLERAQEEDEDEDGKYLTTASDWKEYVDDEQIGDALESYLNYYTKKGKEVGIGGMDEWASGTAFFLIVTCENVDDEDGIYNEDLRNEAKQTLGC